MAAREKLCGGALSSRITPVAYQGPCFRGNLLPAGSPAKARNPLLASDLNMKIRNSFSFGTAALIGAGMAGGPISACETADVPEDAGRHRRARPCAGR